MGVEGVALATDIGQFLSFIFILRFMMKSQDMYRLELRKIRVDKKTSGKIIKVGIPTGIQNMMIAFPVFLEIFFIVAGSDNSLSGDGDGTH